ncbi:transcription initiation factor IID, subunit [Dictyocaulus viviparus]|uniref:Transcription initiation factor IID, subunit n=1 Tax=Dictyocaulus viviparus TaxID=29172 RepID=A0A0D8Y0X0_DICVI|nr:transcription initiation factor IID, subunit [Dictyocaulus viviparus]
MQLTASTIAQGRNVICIETERGFSVKRVRQMLGYRTSDIDGAMQRLLMSSPNTLEQLMHLLTKLEQPASQLAETSVLIVDSIATLFRGYHGKEDFQNWERVMTILNNIAVHHNVAVVYVNHITFRHDVLSRRWKAVPFFSHVYSRSPTIRIWLERSLSESQKSGRIIVIKSPFSAKLSSNCFITLSRIVESLLVIKNADALKIFGFVNKNFAGVSEERNEIVMELDVEDFEKSLSSAHSYLKIKLRQKSNQKPFLQLELRDKGIIHELPVKLVKTAYWEIYQRPNVNSGIMGLYFPPIKSVMRVLHSLKHVGNKNITIKVSNNGEMRFKCRMDQAEITVYFTELENDTITEEQSQDHWCTVRLSLKAVHLFFSSFMFLAHSNVLLNVLSDRFAEFVLRRDGFVVSFLEFFHVGDVLRALGQNPTEAEIGRCCAAYEKEARLSFEDFVPIYQSVSKNREKHTVEEFVEGLSHFDKEGNGLINVAELRERLSDEEVDQLLAGHNDCHGNVNIADFIMSGPGGPAAGGETPGYVDDPDGGDGVSMDASRDISHIKAILEEAGIVDYDPRVVHLLLDLLYTTTSGLLTEAKAISQHCGKMVIDETDVQMAVDFSGILYDTRPKRAEILKMASDRNAQPLPQIRHNFGLKLPNDRFCLLQPNVEWRGSDRTTADLLSNSGSLTAGQVPGTGTCMDDTLQQLRPEHVTNLLKRPAEEDFDA